MSLGLSDNRTRFTLRTSATQYAAFAGQTTVLLGSVPKNQSYRVQSIQVQGSIVNVTAGGVWWARVWWSPDSGTTKYDLITPLVTLGAGNRSALSRTFLTDLRVPPGALIGLEFNAVLGTNANNDFTGCHFTIRGELESPDNRVLGPTSIGRVCSAANTPVTLATGVAGQHIVLTRIGMRFLGTTNNALQLRAVDDVGAGAATEIFTLWANNPGEGFRKDVWQPVHIALPAGYGVQVEALGTGSANRGGCYIDYFLAPDAPNFDNYVGF